MDTPIEKKPFNKRAFVSIATFISVLILPVSGIMNHYYGFDPLSPGRHFWMSVHNMTGAIFVIFVLLHIILNWRPLKNYILQSRQYLVSKELLTAGVIVLGIVFLFASHAFHVQY